MLINEHGSKSGEKSIKLEDVALKFPHLTLPDTGNGKVKLSCHCELTIALHRMKTHQTPTAIKIGVSKRVCWLCQKYLERLSAHYNVRILISEYQGKCRAGWRLPPGTPGPVEDGMRQLIEGEINEIRKRFETKAIRFLSG